MTIDRTPNGDENSGAIEDRVLGALKQMQPAASAQWVWRIAGLLILAAGLVLAVVWAFPAGSENSKAVAGDASEPERTKYTCGMHPEIVQDEPGMCPVCGMKLTPMRKATGKVEGGISIDTRVRQNMGIRTDAAKRTRLTKTIRTVGHVDYDERRIAVMTTKIDGWIEGLQVNYTGQAVKMGEPLFAIYSPQLVSTQAELLAAKRAWEKTQSKADLNTLEMTRQRLRLWDISAAQIERIETSGKAERTLTIEVPHDGIVVQKKAFDGQFVRAGTELFRIADLSQVWIYAHLYEMDVPFVQAGARVSVQMPYDAGPPLEGRVDFVFPWLDAQTREVKARLVFDNQEGRLKPEMYVYVDLTADLGKEALVIDDSAVIRTGVRNVVFVEVDPGVFVPRDVTLGHHIDRKVEIIDGLRAGEKVVIQGQFMLDSESRLKQALRKDEVQADAPGPDGALQALERLVDKGCTHTCPMESHFHICGKGPGKCEECGMTLHPISELKEKRAPKSGTPDEATDPHMGH